MNTQQSHSGVTTHAAADDRHVVVLDVMDTIIKDPFFTEMPKFFDLSFKELLEAKHPTAWVEFEKDLITEEQLFAKFFKDGRSFDGKALVDTMVAFYDYIDGMEPLLARLQAAGYTMHLMSNYPMWYRYIEQKVQLSKYAPWSFVSCTGPMRGLRKPAFEAYQVVHETLGVAPSQIVFVDDRQANVDGAVAAGLKGVRFESALQLEVSLRQLGLEF